VTPNPSRGGPGRRSQHGGGHDDLVWHDLVEDGSHGQRRSQGPNQRDGGVDNPMRCGSVEDGSHDRWMSQGPGRLS
jgi:hypothetical protein